MTTTDLQARTARPLRTGADRRSTTLFTVIGFDGSAPSQAALDAATELIRGRNGHLEIVYVAHLPAYAGMSAPAIVGLREGFDTIADELNGAARTALDDREPRWHFQRRDGAIAEELLGAATELRRRYGPAPAIVIVVGASAHSVHHVAGSVGVALARNAGFPLLVIPAEPCIGRAEAMDSANYLG